MIGLGTEADIQGHPKYGASWEGFALEQVLSAAGSLQAYFWGTHAGAELDLMLLRRGKRYGMEFKASAAPDMTRSLYVALEDLGLEHAWIVYPGRTQYRVHERVEVAPLPNVLKKLATLR